MIGHIKYGIDWSASRPGLRKEKWSGGDGKKEQGQNISEEKDIEQTVDREQILGENEASSSSSTTHDRIKIIM